MVKSMNGSVDIDSTHFTLPAVVIAFFARLAFLQPVAQKQQE